MLVHSRLPYPWACSSAKGVVCRRVEAVTTYLNFTISLFSAHNRGAGCDEALTRNSAAPTSDRWLDPAAMRTRRSAPPYPPGLNYARPHAATSPCASAGAPTPVSARPRVEREQVSARRHAPHCHRRQVDRLRRPSQSWTRYPHPPVAPPAPAVTMATSRSLHVPAHPLSLSGLCTQRCVSELRASGSHRSVKLSRAAPTLPS